MVEISDNDKNLAESKKSWKDALEDKIKFRIEELKRFVHDLSYDDAVKKIKELKKKYPNLIPAYDIALSYLDKKIPENGKNGYNALLQDFINNEVKDFDKITDTIIESGIDKEIKIEIREELQDEYEKGTPKKEIESHLSEIIDENEVSLSENEEEDVAYNLSRPDADKVKKIYKYKVEEKITSGIKDLDTFLEIIQPALNQLIIIPWKFTYETLDAKDMVLEKFENWQTNKKNTEQAFKTFKALGAIPDDVELTSSVNVKKMQNQTAGYIHKYLLEKLNEQLKKEKLEEIDRIKTEKGCDDAVAEEKLKEEFGDKYEDRKKVFDFSKEPDSTKKVLANTLIELIKSQNCRGSDGKITKDGEKLIKGFSYAIDMFNLKNDDKMNQFTNLVKEMISESNGRSEVGDPNVEDDANFVENLKQKEDDDDLIKRLNAFMKSESEDKTK